MDRAYRGSFTALLAMGLLALALPQSAEAAPGEGALSGPAAAIAKARAAADQAEERAVKSDAQSAAAFEGAAAAPKRVDPHPGAAGPAAGQAAPQEQAGSPPADGSGEVRHVYDSAAHRDPFRPPRLDASAQARTPLEHYQLGQLKLVGVIAESLSGYRAMVEDSAGLGYIITTGTPIGSSGGVVRSIEPRRVVIEESTRDFYGDLKPKEVVMELPQEDRSP